MGSGHSSNTISSSEPDLQRLRLFEFAGGVSVVAESSHWRLVDGGRVIITDEDHGQLFGRKEPLDAASRVQAELSDATVSRVEFSAVSDLLLSFSNGHLPHFSRGQVHASFRLNDEKMCDVKLAQPCSRSSSPILSCCICVAWSRRARKGNGGNQRETVMQHGSAKVSLIRPPRSRKPLFSLS